MQLPPKMAESRREFFRAAARYGLLALVSVGAVLAARPGRPSGQRCVNRGICSGCGIFVTCGLPPVLSARHAQGKG